MSEKFNFPNLKADNDNNKNAETISILLESPEAFKSRETLLSLLELFVQNIKNETCNERAWENYNSIFLSVDRNKELIDILIDKIVINLDSSIKMIENLMQTFENTNSEDHKLFSLIKIFIYLYKTMPEITLKKIKSQNLEIILDFYNEFMNFTEISNDKIIELAIYKQIIINSRLCILQELQNRNLQIPKIRNTSISIFTQNDNNIISFLPKKDIENVNYLRILEGKYREFENSLRELFREKYNNENHIDTLLSISDHTDEDLLASYVKCEEFINLL